MVKFEGVEEIEKKLEDIAECDKLQQAIEKSCALVERSAKEYAPRKTGALKRSITSEIEDVGEDIQGVVFTPLEYAPYVEYGTGIFSEKGGRETPWHYQNAKGEWITTRGQQPQPFMRPALDDNRETIIGLLQEALKND